MVEQRVLDLEKGGLLTQLSHTWHHQRDPSPSSILATSVETDPSKRRLAADLFEVVENSTAYHTVTCLARPEDSMLRVGPDDFRDVESDRCHVFSAKTSSSSSSLPGATSPHALWELVDLGNGAVGLRALSNGKFLKVVPPRADDWNAPWKVEVVSNLPGLAERFQLSGSAAVTTEGDTVPSSSSGGSTAGMSTVKLYSELMHGYLQCSGTGMAEELKGFPGETLYEESDVYHFALSKASPQEVATSRTLRAASRHVEATQQGQIATYLARKKMAGSLPRPGSMGGSEGKQPGFKVALCVPMTSRGTDMASVDQSPLWFNLFASFMESVDWATNPHSFTFYVGLDRGDPLYDTGDAWPSMREAFEKNTRRALAWLSESDTAGNATQASVQAQQVLDRMLHLKLMDFGDTAGAPSQVVVGLAQQAYADGCDYFFQVNDDTVIVSKGWADSFINELASNPIHPNLGITGPVDTNNPRILTHAFAHRTHVELFGFFFPKAFKNWWSDDWISTVYGSLHTFRMAEVLITHNVQSQKTGSFQRYEVNNADQLQLDVELARGFVTINKWLISKGLPRLPLPNVCGYSPLMGKLYGPLMEKGLQFSS